MRVIQKKVCLLGDFAVGKTSLIRRFIEGRFDDRYLSSIGVKISRKSLDQDDHTLNLLIWDLAGGDDFGNSGVNYLRGAAGALIVCDLTRGDTLEAYERYAGQLRALNPDIALVFIGNKVDLTEELVINEDGLSAIATLLGGPYVLTSAKTGEQVEAAFHLLAERLKVPA